MNLYSANLRSLAAAVGCLAALPLTGAHAANFNYHVDVNVASLITAPTTGPYAVDFQLNGDGLPAAGTNTVTLSNFSFTLGAAAGTPSTFEGASGSLSSSVVLTLNSGNTSNEFFQQFSATTTDIQFDVSTTQNGSGITPDEFLVAILDNTQAQIATNAPDQVSLLTQPINGAVTLASVQTYQSTSPAGVTANAVPEPSTIGAMLIGLGGLLTAQRRKRA